MSRGRARGISVATAATVDHAIASIWNPHATRRIELNEFGFSSIAAPGAAAGFYWRRITARGTPGSTVTPSLENADRRDAIPPSGWLLDLAVFTVQPTLVTLGHLGPGWVLSAVIGSGIIYPFTGPTGIIIPPGTGLALLNRAAIIVPAGEISVVVED